MAKELDMDSTDDLDMMAELDWQETQAAELPEPRTSFGGSSSHTDTG